MKISKEHIIKALTYTKSIFIPSDNIEMIKSVVPDAVLVEQTIDGFTIGYHVSMKRKAVIRYLNRLFLADAPNWHQKTVELHRLYSAEREDGFKCMDEILISGIDTLIRFRDVIYTGDVSFATHFNIGGKIIPVTRFKI